MSYTRETWVELASTDPSSTPITAIRLNNIEFGIENSHGRSLVTTARDLLVSSDGNLFTGRVIWNSTLSRAQWWDGSTWASGSAGGELPADVTKTTAEEGTSRIIARADHKHDIQTTTPSANVTKAAAVEGSAATLARSDHKHDIDTAVPSANVTAAAASEGTASSVTRSDHKHDVGVGTPVSIQLLSSEGTSVNLVRRDHKHGHLGSNHEPGGAMPMTVDAAVGTGSLRTLGTTSGVQAFPGDAQASAAEINGETNVDKYVPPDLMKHIPGIVGAFANFEQIGTHTITNSFNCTSIADNGTGKSTITLTNSIGGSPTAIGVSGADAAKHCITITVGATSVRCDFSDDSHADADTSLGRMIAIGSLA